MTRLGDFTLLSDLGRSALTDRYTATHNTQGGPFFLKVYSRLPASMHPALLARCESLLSKQHPNLVRHLGHGMMGGVPFTVAPFLDGIDLVELCNSLRDRRVVMGLEATLLVLVDLARAVAGLHDGGGAPALGHGDVSLGHVRIGPQGQVWLTGLCTPRDDGSPDSSTSSRFDLAGVGALLYDLVPVLRGGQARAPLPVALDRVVGRALGIGAQQLQPLEWVERVLEVARTLNLTLDRAQFAELVQRTLRAVDKREIKTPPPGGTLSTRLPSDAVATLSPVDRLPTLEPLQQPPPAAAVAPRMVPARAPTPRASPTPLVELIPIPTLERPAAIAREGEARTELLRRADTLPLRSPTATTTTSATPTAGAARAAGAPPQVRPALRAETAASIPPVPPPLRPQPPGAMARPMPRLLPADEPLPQAPKRESKRPLLADPPPPATQAPRAELNDQTGEHTDPDQRLARADLARRDPAVRALIERRVVSDTAVDAAVAEHVLRGGRVIEILCAQGATSDALVAIGLASAAGALRLSDDALLARRPAPSLVRRVPQTYVLARRVLPLSLDSGRLALAMADPFDKNTIEELKSLMAASSVEIFVAARKSITAATVEVYRALTANSGVVSAPTVLVVTHDEHKAARFGGRLVQEGMRVEHVVTGRAALEILKTRPPSCVLCSHDVSAENAQALLLFVRQQARTAELPFFVMGPRDDTLATRHLDLGADDYFSEPLRFEVVLSKVRRAVGKGNARGSHDGEAVAERSGLFSTPPQLAAPVARPSTAPQRAPVSTAAPIADLDSLPELPFGEDDDGASVAAMPTGVMGTLRQMPVPEIVQSLEMGRKTARVDLVPTDGDKGMIAFENGQVRYAECGSLRADEAFYLLVRHKDGFFRIHYGDKPPAYNIDAPTTFLLLEAMRRLDEEGQPPAKTR